MDVSVVIVNWNNRELLRDCLVSIERDAGKVSYEIIVVDNASADDSGAMVRSEFPQVRLISEPTNRGYAGAVNDGIRLSRGRYVLVLNNDIVIGDAAIEKTVGFADRRPEAAVVGCQVRESTRKVQMTCFRFPSVLNLCLDALGLGRIFPNNRFFGREHILWWGRDSERQVDVVSGMFMLVRHEAIEQVGAMDESYFLYFEDSDWCYRFWRAGWKMVFWPGAWIIHREGGGHSATKNAANMLVQFQKSQLLFFKKHRGPAGCLAGRVLLGTGNGLRCLVWAVRAGLKRLSGQDSSRERAEKEKRWAILKYCLLGTEPEKVSACS